MEAKRKMKHRDKIVSYLIWNPYATVLEMSTNLRITNVPARLSELRAQGILMQARCHEENEDGEMKHFNRYWIRKEYINEHT